MKQTFIIKTTLLEDGRLMAVICNVNGKEIAQLKHPVDTGEEAEILAREFFEDNPDLFEEDVTLLESAAVSEQKNPELYGDGNLQTIPEN